MRVRDISLIDVMKKYAHLHETDFTKEGNNRWEVSCLNPEHRDGKPSLNVYDKTADGEGWDYYCYTCKFSGNAMNLLVSLGVAKDTDEAKGILMEDFGLTPPSVMNLVNFCEYKGIDPKFARDNGWEDIEGGLLIPFYSEDDVVIAKKVRTRFEGKPKYYYISRPEYENNPPYGLHWIRDYTDDVLYITEGETDASTMAQAGLQALGIPSTNAWNSKYAEKIRRFKKLVVVKDNDAAGDNLVNALKEDFPDKTYVLLLPKGAKDINSYYTDVCGCDAEKFTTRLHDLAVIPSGKDTFVATIKADNDLIAKTELWSMVLQDLPNPIIEEDFIKEVAEVTGRSKKVIKETLAAVRASNERSYQPSEEWYELTKSGVRLDSYKYAKHIAETQPICVTGTTWHLYQNGVYKPVPDAYIFSIITEGLIDECKKDPQNIKNTLFHLEHNITLVKATEDFDKDPYIMNLQNGLLDIRTMEIAPHTPAYYSLVQLNTAHDPAIADDTLLKEYLAKKIPNLVNQRLAQEIMGYAISTFFNAEKWFLLQGRGRSGKGTFLYMVETILGTENVSNIALQNLGDRFSKAGMFGKLANIDADLSSEPIKDQAVKMLKSLIGRDSITAEFKGKDTFSFRNKATMIFGCNELPKNTGDFRNASFWDKLVILKMDESDTQDVRTMFKVELTQPNSIAAVLMWAIEGLRRLIDNDFVFTESADSDIIKHNYKIKSSSVLEFTEEFCELDPVSAVTSAHFMERYSAWCKANNYHPKGVQNVIAEIKEFYGVEIAKKRSRYNGVNAQHIHGISIISEF